MARFSVRTTQFLTIFTFLVLGCPPPALAVDGLLWERKSSQFLVCLGADVDVFLSAELSICSDSRGRLYHIIALGAGFAFGISANVYGLRFVGRRGASIEGRYIGGRGSGAFNKIGFSGGIFEKVNHPANRDSSMRVYLFGYVRGIGFEATGLTLLIHRL